jgi:hypothetical protein
MIHERYRSFLKVVRNLSESDLFYVSRSGYVWSVKNYIPSREALFPIEDRNSLLKCRDHIQLNMNLYFNAFKGLELQLESLLDSNGNILHAQEESPGFSDDRIKAADILLYRVVKSFEAL